MAGYSLYSLNIAGNANLAFTLTTDTLNIVSGGLLKSANNGNFIGGANTTTGTADFGRLTAGGTSTGVNSLYVYNNENTLTINSRIIDNASGGQTRLVLSGASTITLTGTNSYTGGTVINTTTTLSGTNAQVVLPSAGGIMINNATLAYATGQSGKIATGANLTINGGGVLNLWGNASLNDFTFDSTSANAAATVRTASVTGANSTTATNSTLSPFRSRLMRTAWPWACRSPAPTSPPAPRLPRSFPAPPSALSARHRRGHEHNGDLRQHAGPHRQHQSRPSAPRTSPQSSAVATNGMLNMGSTNHNITATSTAMLRSPWSCRR